MDVVPRFQQTNVGIIPSDWKVRTIADIASVGRGRVISHKEISKSLGKLYPVYSSQTSNRGVMGYIDTFDFEGEYITWTTDGANAGTVFARNGRFNCTNVCGTIKVYTDNYRFVALVLNRIAPHHVSKHLGNPKLMNDVMKKIEIPLPNKREEQDVIVAALDDVDALLDALERLITKKRDIKQAAMQQLLTGQTRLPGFSGEWKMMRLGDHVRFLRNGTNARAELTSTGTVKYLHYGDIHACTRVHLHPDDLPFLPSHKAKNLERLTDGDLIFADASEDLDGVGKSVEIFGVKDSEVVSGLHTIAARFDKEVLADGFKAYLQFCPVFNVQLRRLAAGTKVYATNRAHVAGVEMRLPSVEEQVAIAVVLSDIDAELTALVQRRDKTRALMQAMMQELLTGKTRLVS